MRKLVRAETLKLRKSASYWILLSAAAVIGLFLGCFFLTSDDLAGGLDGFNQAMDAIQADTILMSLFAAFFISSEFSNRTIGAGIVGGHSRSKILLSKISVFFLGALPILLAIPFFITAVLTIVNGFGVPITADVIAYLVRTVILYLLGGVAMAVCCALIAFIVRNVGGTIGVGVIFLIMLFFFTLFKPLDSVTRFLFMWQLTHITTLTAADSFFSFGVVVITILLITFISAAVFRKADLK